MGGTKETMQLCLVRLYGVSVWLRSTSFSIPRKFFCSARIS